MTSSCNNNAMTRKTTYSRNMLAPRSLDIFHLLTAMAITTAINIMKSKNTEQKRPLLLTITGVPRCIALDINHGTGNLQKNREQGVVKFCKSDHLAG